MGTREEAQEEVRALAFTAGPASAHSPWADPVTGTAHAGPGRISSLHRTPCTVFEDSVPGHAVIDRVALAPRDPGHGSSARAAAGQALPSGVLAVRQRRCLSLWGCDAEAWLRSHG